jgi:hypothetical protein
MTSSISYETPIMSYRKSVEILKLINSVATFEETTIGEDQIVMTFNDLDQHSYESIKNSLG